MKFSPKEKTIIEKFNKEKEAYSKEYNSIPYIFAFTEEDFDKQYEKLLNLYPDQKEQPLIRDRDTGILSTRFLFNKMSELWKEELDRRNRYIKEYDCIVYYLLEKEFWNCEYAYNWYGDQEVARAALNMSYEEMSLDERLNRIWNEVRRDYMERAI